MNDTTRAILDRFDGSLPLERASMLPGAAYAEPAFFAWEDKAVFSGAWQYVCSLGQLEGSGSVVLSHIGTEPIVAVRAEDGRVRVFLNICRHRAAPVVQADDARLTRLRCQYHGWTYDLAGCLRGVPEFDGVCDFKREDNGLVELETATSGDFLFARFKGSSPSLREHLHPLPERMAGRLDGLSFFRRVRFPVACNWKIYVDNYLDGGYHVNTVHPALAGSLDYKLYRTETFDACSVQSSPLTANADDASANRTRSGDMAFYWWVFPNFMLNVYDGVADVNYVIPRGPDRCEVVFDFFFAGKDDAFMEESVKVAEQVQEEDRLVCEAVQRNIGSRYFIPGRFSVKRENGGYHFHRLLAARLRETERS